MGTSEQGAALREMIDRAVAEGKVTVLPAFVDSGGINRMKIAGTGFSKNDMKNAAFGGERGSRSMKRGAQS